MRIAQYMHRVDFEDGGPPRAVVDLSRVLHDRGHEVTLVTTDARDVPESWLSGSEGPAVLVYLAICSCVDSWPPWPD